jgi:hypothetical protein
VTGNGMSFAESFEDLKVWQRARTLRASHSDNDRAGDFLLKN